MKDESIVFSVRFPKWLFDQLNLFCRNNERTRNWMIKKQIAHAIGQVAGISDKPDKRDDVINWSGDKAS